MYCIHCGTLLSDGARFCRSCGKQVTVISQNTTSVDQYPDSEIGRITQDNNELQKKESKLTTEASDVVLRTSRLTLSRKMAFIVALGIMVIAIPFLYKGIISSNKYKEAEGFATNGNFRDAIAAFEELEEYKDSAEKAKQMSIALAEEYLLQDDIVHAAMAYGKAGEYDLSCELYWDKVTAGNTIAVEQDDVIAVKTDGTVVSNADHVWTLADDADAIISDWTDTIAVSVDYGNVIGLKSDGTVVSADDGYLDFSGWNDIVSISCNNNYIIGLKSDGTIMAAEDVNDEMRNNLNLSDLADCTVVLPSCIYIGNTERVLYDAIGIKQDGTVVVASSNNEFDYSEILGWTDIREISCYFDGLDSIFIAAGLKKDGTVVTTGMDVDVSTWTDVVAVSVSSPTLTSIYDGIVTNNAAVVGLKSDGTIIIAGKEDEIDLSEFMDVKIH